MQTPLAIEWIGDVDGCLRLIDQTLLPTELRYLDCNDVATVWEAIKMLRVRGAPAIGVAAAFGMVLAGREHRDLDVALFHNELANAADYLKSSRPTAVNLFWAIDRMTAKADQLRGLSPELLLQELLAEAEAIRVEDREMCAAIGRHGAELLSEGQGVLTHCNAGALATSDFGTALSVLFHANDAGKRIHVYVDETRPLLQGSRLTAWELMQHNVPCTLICDSAAGMLMRQGKIQAAVVGADRIAANGDAANKIGTYTVAVLAMAHGVPFYVAAPSSTFDFSLSSGESIPIEERDPAEITHGMGKQTAPDGVQVYNPAFDVTPAELITAFITEKGVLRPPFMENLAAALQSNAGSA